MYLKSYFSSSVEAAMALARKELGPEAMLVSSRKSPSESLHLGQYEVVFAEDSAGIAEPVRHPIGRGPSEDHSQFADIRSQLAGIRTAIANANLSAANAPDVSPELAEIQHTLDAQEIDGEVARDLLHSVSERARGDHSRARLQNALIAEMSLRIKVDSRLGREGQSSRIVALVGPPGRGKTTTLIKLAARYGIAGRVPVRLLSTDTLRIAAADQMRVYAAILGIRFQAVNTVPSLAQELDSERGGGLTFIDTAGLGRAEMEEGTELARYFAERNDVDVHLALSVDMKLADIRSAMERYRIFRPSKFIFTGIDGTESFGAMFSAAALCQQPVSFLTTGQQIPEDLEPATVQRIVDLALNGGRKQASAAA